MDAGDKVSVVAKVKNIHKSRNNVMMIVLEDIYINGNYFRDHLYVRRAKRLSCLNEGDFFTATAIVYLYPDIETNRVDKVGLDTFRSVKIV